MKIILNISEYLCSFSLCAIFSVEILKESVNYLILSILIFVVRWLASKVEKKIINLKKNKENDTE